MRQRFLLGALAIVVLGLCSAASAATITSSDFTFAFGDVPSGVWALEPTGGNSDYTQGDFTLTPAPTGSYWSGKGPAFVNRVLVNGDNSYSGDTVDFALPITASYNGSAPADVDLANPGYKLRLELTNLSTYGMSYTGYADTMAFQETTAGHSATSSSIGLVVATSMSQVEIASNYTHLVWNPDDFSVSLDDELVNRSSMRSFNITPSSDMLMDGVEVMGRVVLEYNAVPEPSAIVLLSVGMLSLLAYAWKKRK